MVQNATYKTIGDTVVNDAGWPVNRYTVRRVERRLFHSRLKN